MYSVVVVFFSFFFSPLVFSSSSSFPIVSLLQKKGRTQSGVGRDRIDAGHASNTGRDKRRAGRGGLAEEGNVGELDQK